MVKTAWQATKDYVSLRVKHWKKPDTAQNLRREFQIPFARIYMVRLGFGWSVTHESSNVACNTIKLSTLVEGLLPCNSSRSTYLPTNCSNCLCLSYNTGKDHPCIRIICSVCTPNHSFWESWRTVLGLFFIFFYVILWLFYLLMFQWGRMSQVS